jgi:hypothetical protein
VAAAGDRRPLARRPLVAPAVRGDPLGAPAEPPVRPLPGKRLAHFDHVALRSSRGCDSRAGARRRRVRSGVRRAGAAAAGRTASRDRARARSRRRTRARAPLRATASESLLGSAFPHARAPPAPGTGSPSARRPELDQHARLLDARVPQMCASRLLERVAGLRHDVSLALCRPDVWRCRPPARGRMPVATTVSEGRGE